MKQILKCRHCQKDLTGSLRAITSFAEMVSCCKFDVEEHVVPQGRYLIIKFDLPARLPFLLGSWLPYEVPWLNLEDLRDTVGLSTNLRVLQGCCDLSGGFGPNRVCKCGHDVGTQYSDCGEYKMFEPLMAATYWEDVLDNDGPKTS